MPFPASPEAADRPRKTIQAARMLAARAPTVAHVCAEAEPDGIVVAVINPDGVFGGAWAIPRAHLYERASRLPSGGWSLTFAPQTTAEEIVARCGELARLARRRWELMQRVGGRP